MSSSQRDGIRRLIRIQACDRPKTLFHSIGCPEAWTVVREGSRKAEAGQAAEFALRRDLPRLTVAASESV